MRGGETMAADPAVADLGFSGILDLYFQRDESAIDATRALYGPLIRSVTARYLTDRADREECENDVYLALWNAIPPARPEDPVAFIAQIASRISVDRFRKETRKKRSASRFAVCLDELREAVGEEDVENRFEAKALGEAIAGFVRSLPERGRFIFISRYYRGAKLGEIARLLGVSRSTVDRELKAMRSQLREKLEREGIGP